jgi:predicted transcriptional regulator
MVEEKWPRKFTMTTTRKEREILENLREYYATEDVRTAIIKAAKEIMGKTKDKEAMVRNILKNLKE